MLDLPRATALSLRWMKPTLLLFLAALFCGGCCLTEKCAIRKDAKWMRSTCRPIPTPADEQECIQNVKKLCLRHGLPENCGESEG